MFKLICFDMTKILTKKNNFSCSRLNVHYIKYGIILHFTLHLLSRKDKPMHFNEKIRKFEKKGISIRSQVPWKAFSKIGNVVKDLF
jgi:hypothetical protein